MALMDEFKDERETIKNASFKEKMQYFWQYYKWWVIGGVIAIIVIVYLVVSMTSKKEEVLAIAMINALAIEDTDVSTSLFEPFLESKDIDPQKNTIYFNNDFIMNIEDLDTDAEMNIVSSNVSYTQYSSTQTTGTSRSNLAVYVAASSIDIITSSEDWFDIYTYAGFYTPVTDVLTEEEIERYSEYFYYADQAVLDRYNEAKMDNNYEYDEELPDAYDIEAMENPVAYGIILNENNALSSCYYTAVENEGDNVIVGIVVNSKHKELAHDFIIALLER